MDTFSKPDFVPMFADNITWHNDSVRIEAEKQCGNDYECLFDVASTNDLSVGMVTKDISIQLVNESNALGKSQRMGRSDMDLHNNKDQLHAVIGQRHRSRQRMVTRARDQSTESKV